MPEDPLEIYDALLLSGKAPDPTSFVKKYPHHPNLLDKIRALSNVHQGLDDLVAHLGKGNQDIPSQVAGCNVIKELGSGGMGRVFLATKDQQQVAVKVLKDTSDVAQKRFSREATMAAGLRHPNMVRLLDHGTDQDQAFLVTEFVQGKNLKDLLANTRMQPVNAPFEQTLADHLGQISGFLDQDSLAAVNKQFCSVLSMYVFWATQIARALAFAHQKAVIHRDVKPSNVMIQRDLDAILIDFGLAVPTQKQSHITRTGTFVGTHAYSAPEQLSGKKGSVGTWTDTYALGATLFELLTLQPPFGNLNFGARIACIWNKPPKTVRELNPTIPKNLERIVTRALEPSIKKRFQHGAEMARALEDWLYKYGCPSALRL